MKGVSQQLFTSLIPSPTGFPLSLFCRCLSIDVNVRVSLVWIKTLCYLRHTAFTESFYSCLYKTLKEELFQMLVLYEHNYACELPTINLFLLHITQPLTSRQTTPITRYGTIHSESSGMSIKLPSEC